MTGDDGVYAEVGGAGVDNPGFEADASASPAAAVSGVLVNDTSADADKTDENQNFYANLASKDGGAFKKVALNYLMKNIFPASISHVVSMQFLCFLVHSMIIVYTIRLYGYTALGAPNTSSGEGVMGGLTDGQTLL